MNENEQTGIITAVHYPLITVEGIRNGKVKELVHFEESGFGQILSCKENTLTVMTFSKHIPRVGSQVIATHEPLTIRVSESLLGCAVDALGTVKFRDEDETIDHERLEIDVPPAPLIARARITNALHTGVSVCDLLLPLGKGQRELIVGDRKTGKSTFLLQTARAQAASGSYIVYAAIGKRSSELRELINTINADPTLRSHTVVVMSLADDPASMNTLTPFTAMTIAEYFCTRGKDVLVVLDDLTTHAKYQRELALLAKQFPGRDSYPGDMFYSHARLLERAGAFTHPDDPSLVTSITCLPVAETAESDLTRYIVSNLISITDGHLLFDASLFSQGRRPPIHTSLSVTRVGKQTQTPLQRELGSSLTAFFGQYDRTRALMHFGAELGEHAKQILTKGDQLVAFFTQPKHAIYPLPVQIVMAAAIFADLFKDQDGQTIMRIRETMSTSYSSNLKMQKIIDALCTASTLEKLNVLLTQDTRLIPTLCKP